MSVCDVPDPRSLPKRHVGRKDDPQSGILDLGFYGAQPLDQDGEASGIGFGGGIVTALGRDAVNRARRFGRSPRFRNRLQLRRFFSAGKNFVERERATF